MRRVCARTGARILGTALAIVPRIVIGSWDRGDGGGCGGAGKEIAVVTRVVNEKEKREPDVSGREEPLTDAGSIVRRAGKRRKTESERVQPAYRGGLSQGPQLAGAAAADTACATIDLYAPSFSFPSNL